MFFSTPAFHWWAGKEVINIIQYISSLQNETLKCNCYVIVLGFGSMLRAIGAQIEKTTNREACRDLSGRRLRDINEEKR